MAEDIKILLMSSFVKFCLEEKSNIAQSIRGQGGHLVFLIGPTSTNLVEDIKILLPVKFRWNLLSGLREVENVSGNKSPRWPSYFSDRPENTNLVGNVEILRPVRFRWIRVSGFREEVEHVSANQRPGWSSSFSDRPEKRGRRHWNLAPCQVSLKSSRRFQRRSRKWLGQSEARGASLFFRSTQKHKCGSRHWDLASCEVSLNSVQRFQRKSRKCEKLTTTDGRQTRVRLRWTKNYILLWEGQRIIFIYILAICIIVFNWNWIEL